MTPEFNLHFSHRLSVCATSRIVHALLPPGPVPTRVLEIRAAKGLGNGYSFGDDFYPIWLTSREALGWHRDPYSVEMTREIQTGLFGRPLDAHIPTDPPTDYRTFAYPAFTNLIFWPNDRAGFSHTACVVSRVHDNSHNREYLALDCWRSTGAPIHSGSRSQPC